MKRVFLACLTIISAFMLPLYSFAQITNQSIALEIYPQFPEAGETFTATIKAPYVDYSSVQWIIDGVENPSYKNTNIYTSIAKDAGLQTNIVARITLRNGEVIDVKKTITPYRIDLIITPDTSVPPFYGGRKLPSSGSSVTITALLFKGSSNLSASDYSYIWKINNTLQSTGPIIGKNTTVFTPGFEDISTVKVDILKMGQIIASKTVSVPILKPELYFYELNPLRGLSFVAIPNPYIFIGDEVTIRGEGYFMNTTLDSNTLTQWQIDRETVQNQNPLQKELTLTKQDVGQRSEISFHIRNLSQLLQGVQKSLVIQF